MGVASRRITMYNIVFDRNVQEKIALNANGYTSTSHSTFATLNEKIV
jgi:hypothetical protein